MNNREAREIIAHERDNDVFVSEYRNKVHEAQSMAIKALEQINGCAYYDSEIKTCRRSEVPREHGEWEKEVFDLGNHLPLWVAYQCSCCNEFFDSEYNFCPHCGADMRGENK